jgi:hypothetical protein
MPLETADVESLRRVFNRGFSARDIAEPLVSFDATASAAETQRLMDERGYEVVGVRREGIVAGYLEKSELGDGPCSDFIRSFDDAHVVSESAPFSDVVLRLQHTPRLFVTLLGQVGGIVTRTDLQKPPVRMWLFGMVTLIEMRFTRMIQQACPNETWHEYLSEGRLAKAKTLLAERTRRNLDIDLLDCVQFSDKGQIVARDKTLRGMTRFESRSQIDQTFKMLERLRNNLSHSQDIISGDWEIIVTLTENLDKVVEGPPGLRENQATHDATDET